MSFPTRHGSPTNNFKIPSSFIRKALECICFFSSKLVLPVLLQLFKKTLSEVMELGESSRSLAGDDAWAKLVLPDSRHADVEIMSDEMVIDSVTTSTSLDKVKWCKIKRRQDLDSAIIQNTSLSTIIVDGTVLGKGEDMIIKCGSEIVSGPDRKGHLVYCFQVIPEQEHRKKRLKISLDVEHAKCSICLSIWHDVVTVAPCLHNFCNGCFSEWLRRSQEKHQTILCPQCRATVQSVGRNHFLHNLEVMLQTTSSLARSDEELALLDTYAAIKSNFVIGTNRLPPRVEPALSSSEESYDTRRQCPQCGDEAGGFRCNPSTIHLQCEACGGMMPARPDIDVPQHCLGCDRVFCGAYWQDQNLVSSDSNRVCSHGTFKPVVERTILRIPDTTHQSNRCEQDITERCIQQIGNTLQDVVLDWITKLDNREIDRTRLPVNHALMITSRTPLCDNCYDKVVDFLLYWFRVSLPKHFLPPDASRRENCWYGYACRTQHHNVEHARKRNHVCRPTRGNLDA